MKNTVKFFAVAIAFVFLNTTAYSQIERKTPSELHSKFQDGSKPNGQDFKDLINATYNYEIKAEGEDGLEIYQGQQGEGVIYLRATSQTDHNFTTSHKEKLDSIKYSEENFTYVLKIKLDSLNYTEHNFIDSLYQKLLGIEHRATYSDNNFADSLLAKLLSVENNANYYELPIASHSTRGGVVLGNTLQIVDGKLEVTIDPCSVEKMYAPDSAATSNWTLERKEGDLWAKLRLIEIDINGDTTYGAWNEPYRLNNQALEDMIAGSIEIDTTNVLIGSEKINSGEQGERNTFVGKRAGQNTTQASTSNVMIGTEAGQLNSAGSHNVIVGDEAGKYTLSSDNVIVGSKASKAKNSTGAVVIGKYASREGANNYSVVIGSKAAEKSSGERNVVIGTEALQGINPDATSNNDNIAIGYRAGLNSLSASGNVFIGNEAGKSNTTGGSNIYIGDKAAQGNNGYNNIVIGNKVGQNLNNESNKLMIGSGTNTLIEGDFEQNYVKVENLETSSIIADTLIVSEVVRVDGVISSNVEVDTLFVESIQTANDIATEGKIIAEDNIETQGQFVGYGTIPIGGIIMWSGDPNTIPDGWALCDGRTDTDINGSLITTPNLSGRFIVAYDAASGDYNNVNAEGGSSSSTATFRLSKNHIPKHHHSVRGNDASIHITSSGSHTHTYESTPSNRKTGGSRSSDRGVHETRDATTTSENNEDRHTHPNSSFSGRVSNGGEDGLKSPADKVTTDNFDIIPPYYVLAFIMRVK